MSNRDRNRYPIAGHINIPKSSIGQKEPVAHPQNCCHECPYGYDRSFCFPCYAKIMAEHRAARKDVDLVIVAAN